MSFKEGGMMITQPNTYTRLRYLKEGIEVEGRFKGLKTLLVDKPGTTIQTVDFLKNKYLYPHIYLGCLEGGPLRTKLDVLNALHFYEAYKRWDIGDGTAFTFAIELKELSPLLESIPALYKILYTGDTIRIVLALEYNIPSCLKNTEVKIDTGKTCFVYSSPEVINTTYAHDREIDKE